MCGLQRRGKQIERIWREPWPWRLSVSNIIYRIQSAVAIGNIILPGFSLADPISHTKSYMVMEIIGKQHHGASRKTACWGYTWPSKCPLINIVNLYKLYVLYCITYGILKINILFCSVLFIIYMYQDQWSRMGFAYSETNSNVTNVYFVLGIEVEVSLYHGYGHIGNKQQLEPGDNPFSFQITPMVF